MNKQPKRNRQLSPLVEAYVRAYAREKNQPGLLNLIDILEQANYSSTKLRNCGTTAK